MKSLPRTRTNARTEPTAAIPKPTQRMSFRPETNDASGSAGAELRVAGGEGGDLMLEDRAERRDPGRDPDLAEGGVDP